MTNPKPLQQNTTSNLSDFTIFTLASLSPGVKTDERRNMMNFNFLVGVWLLCACLMANAGEIQDADELLEQGQLSQALEIIERYLTGNPKDTQARFLKGRILAEQGHADEAIMIFSTLTKDTPNNPKLYSEIAVQYASQGDYERAWQALEKAIRIQPDNSMSHENIGDFYVEMAQQSYGRSSQLDEGNIRAQNKLTKIQEFISSVLKDNSQNQIVTSSNQEEILKTVNDWASAWSSKNVEKYLGYYTDDFTNNGNNHKAWEETRRKRIGKPRTINVKISGETVDFIDSSHATVTFHQCYRANDNPPYSDIKILLMIKSDGKWLIQKENAYPNGHCDQ